MKKYIKVILNICIVCFMLLNICVPSIYAADTTMGGIVKDANDFLQEGLSKDNPLNPGALESGSKLLYNILFTIGIAVALIWGLVLAIQFITGSIGEKADVKKNLVVYVIGCIIIFGAFGIWSMLLNFLEPISK